MANPEFEDVLDGIDKLSVILYRVGIVAFALSCWSLALSLFSRGHSLSFPSVSDNLNFLFFGVSAVLCSANIHVYSKLIRLIISWASWIGILVLLAHPGATGGWVALGFLFITFSGIALKESFCFQVFGLKWSPILLAASIGGLLLNYALFSAVLMVICGAIFLYLASVKWSMPLHFDIGIKSNYQI